MRLRTILTALAIAALFVAPVAAQSTDSLMAGKADLQSAGILAFGPDGVLFVGDSVLRSWIPCSHAFNTPRLRA